MSGSLKNIKRLKEHQENKIRNCLERIHEFEKLREDYNALKARLETISDRLTYDVMVPMGDVAFMPGFLTHTNEILVLLGDNWFVERSAKQAVAITERRLASCKKMLEDLQKEKQQYSDWMDYTSEMQGNEDLVEIIEEYDPEKEKLWHEQHQKNMQKYRKEMGQLQTNDDSINKDMNLLHLHEKSNNSEDTENNMLTNCEADRDIRTRQVRWQDEVDEQAKISATHSLSLPFSGHEQQEENSEIDEPTLIQSPADIYKQFALQTSEPKSILKNKSMMREVVKDTEPEHTKSVCVEPPPIQAFSGEVIERKDSDSSFVAAKTTRQTSRFKAGRKKT